LADDDSTLILSLKDGVTTGLAKTNAALRATATEVSNLDVRITALEGSLAATGTKAAATASSMDKVTLSSNKAVAVAVKQTAAYKALVDAQAKLAATAVPKYEASNLNVLPNGTATSKGVSGFISSADVSAAKEYEAALAAVAVAESDVAIEQGQIEASQAFDKLIADSTAARHAISEASTAALGLGAALLALPIASAVIAVDYQRDFASVQRALLAPTTQANALKSELLQLSETTPISFQSLTAIAAAGAQMGIAASDVVEFTRVVAELTITTNTTAASAESFVRKFQLIAGVGSDQFSNLISSLLNVGIHTGATEAQIALLATQIVGIGQVAGFTVPQIIGLSAALASINSTGPSRARGTVVRLITDIQTAVISGTPALAAFAQTAGVTAATVQADFGTDKFAGVFEKFIAGLDQVQKSTGDANLILNKLGITSTVDIPLILNLANAHKLLNTAITDAGQGYADASILAQHYSIVAGTISAQTTDLKNGLGVLANSIGSAAIPALNGIVKGLEGLVDGLVGFNSTAVGTHTLDEVLGIAIAVGGIAILLGTLGKLSTTILAVGKAYEFVTDAVTTLKAAQVAMAATGEASFLGVLAASGPLALAILGIAAGLTTLSIVSQIGVESQTQLQNSLTGTSASVNQIVKSANDGTSWFQQFGNFLVSGGNSADLATSQIKDLDGSLNKFASSNFFVNTQTQLLVGTLNAVGTSLANLSQSNLPDAQNAFDKFAAKTNGSQLELSRLLNTMPAYKTSIDTMLQANGQAVTSQNEISLATGSSTDTYKAVTDAIKSATSAQNNYQAALDNDLGGNKAVASDVTAYQKSVSSLVNLSDVVTETQQTIAGAAAKTGKTYDGTSVTLDQLTKQYQANNIVQQQWANNLIIVAAKYGSAVEGQFITAGYSAVNGSILEQLAKAAPAQGKAYASAMTQAMTEAGTATADAVISAGHLINQNGTAIGASTAAAIGAALQAGIDIPSIMKEFNLQFDDNPIVPQVNLTSATTALSNWVKGISSTSLVLRPDVVFPGASGSGASGGYYSSAGNFTRGFSGGGYTGPGAKYKPAGLVHAGEFVFTKAATSSIGVQNLYAMMQAAGARRGYASGGSVGGSSSPSGAVIQVALSQYDRALLAAAGNVSLVITAGQLAAASNSQGVVASNRRAS